MTKQPHPSGTDRIRVASTYGRRLTVATFVTGLIAFVVLWGLTRSSSVAGHLLWRFTVFSIAVGAAGFFGRLICGGESIHLFTRTMHRGDLACGIGLVAGLAMAATLHEKRSHSTAVSNNPLKIGQPIVIEGPTFDGGTFSLTDHKGKVVLVDFWATWCGPCVAELPNIQSVYQKYHAEGLEVVSVSFDEKREPLERFLNAHEMPWPQIYFDAKEESGFNNPLGRRYEINGIPHVLVVDRAGNLAATNVRGRQTEAAIIRALGRSAPIGLQVSELATSIAQLIFTSLYLAPAWLMLVCIAGVTIVAACIERLIHDILFSRVRPNPSDASSSEPSGGI